MNECEYAYADPSKGLNLQQCGYAQNMCMYSTGGTAITHDAFVLLTMPTGYRPHPIIPILHCLYPSHKRHQVILDRIYNVVHKKTIYLST